MTHVSHPWMALIACVATVMYLVEGIATHLFASMAADLLLAATTAVMALTAYRPRIGAWAMLAVLIVNACVPFRMPSIITTLFIVDIGILGYLTTYGTLLAVPFSLAAMMISSRLNGMDDTMGGLDILTGIVILGAAAVMGALLRQIHLGRQAEIRNKLAGERIRLASALHDSISNQLGRLLVQLDIGTLNETQLKEDLVAVLDETHHIIEVLEDPTDAPPESPLWPHVTQLLAKEQQRLQRDGFRGEVLAPDPESLPDIPSASLLRKVIVETFVNIAKHANPAYPYLVTLQTQDGSVMFQVSDICRAEDTARHGLSSGLLRHSRQLEGIGGSAHWERHGNRWRATFMFPAASAMSGTHAGNA
ncbi:histidine protein kinase [Bifidobacterium cuniculi]|uniref:Histidine protein kinase n=2 Tax=Bifidobacterium cuniculi TaxID=1688 RepID=A0A087B3B6_9BIFI|nr:histidine protein kinase [Bifidobacterium cuniculi]